MSQKKAKQARKESVVIKDQTESLLADIKLMGDVMKQADYAANYWYLKYNDLKNRVIIFSVGSLLGILYIGMIVRSISL